MARLAWVLVSVPGCGSEPANHLAGHSPTSSAGVGAGATGGSGSLDDFGNVIHPRTSGTGGGPPTIKGMGCADAMVHTSTVTPTIVFVVDGSGSMCEVFGNATRWTALRSALLEPTMGLINQFQDRVEFGMLLYDGTIDLLIALQATANSPSPVCAGAYLATKGAGECPQLIQVLPAALHNAAAIDAAFPQVELGGSTPTDRAMNTAIDQLIALQTNDPDAAMHPQYVILATDGQPNDICVGGTGGDGSAQKQAVIAAVDRGAAKGIKTFVISLAGSDAALQQHLTEVAMHGNPKDPAAHTFSPTTPQDLVDALAGLIGGAVGCEVFLNGKVKLGAECSGYVEVSGVRQPCCKDVGGGAFTCNGMPATPPNGWILKTPGSIELVGETCTSFLKSPDATLRAGFPCEAFVD